MLATEMERGSASNSVTGFMIPPGTAISQLLHYKAQTREVKTIYAASRGGVARVRGTLRPVGSVGASLSHPQFSQAFG